MPNFSVSSSLSHPLFFSGCTYDTLLGGGLDIPSRTYGISASKLSVFYSGDSQDTRRLGQLHVGESLDDYVDDYAVLHESAITALRTR
ncbi:MAG: hypothetical protein AAFR25_11110 [Cyanobacteria bacterium J06629_19]